MNDLQRLEAMALEGDVDAARRWIAELQRRGDATRAAAAPHELVAAAATREDATGLAALGLVLDATDAVAGHVAQALDEGDLERLDRLGRALGLGLDGAACAAIERLVRQVNRGAAHLVRDHLERRRARHTDADKTPPTVCVLEPRDVLAALLRARLLPDGLGVGVGPRAVKGEGGIALAVRLEAQLVVGATHCNKSGGSPGRAWQDLQPWRKNLARNRERATAWAAHEAPDRVAVLRLELPRDARQHLEQRRRDIADPLARLLAADPSKGGFNKLVAAVNDAAPEQQEQLVASLEHHLAGWPHALRGGARRWLGALAVDRDRGHWRPGWQLVRRLELDGTLTADDPGLDALLASPFAAPIETLELDRVALPVLERLLAGHRWPSLRRIDLRVCDLTAAVASLRTAAPGILQRVGRVVLRPDGPSCMAFKGLDAWPDQGLALHLAWRWERRRGEDKVLLRALTELAAAVGELEALADTWWDVRLRWIEPWLDQGALRRARCLRINAEGRFKAGLRAMLEHENAPQALEALTVKVSCAGRLEWLGDFAASPLLAGVRCLALIGECTGEALSGLLGSPLFADLEALHLWRWPHGTGLHALARALASPTLAGLRELGLNCNDAVPVVSALHAAGSPTALRRLMIREPRPAILEQLASIRPDLELVGASGG